MDPKEKKAVDQCIFEALRFKDPSKIKSFDVSAVLKYKQQILWEGGNALWPAIEARVPSIVEYLLEIGVDPSIEDKDGKTALVRAASMLYKVSPSGSEDDRVRITQVIRLLLAHLGTRARAAAPDLLAILAYWRQNDLLREVVDGEYGFVDIGASRDRGRTALHWVAFYGEREALKHMLDSGRPGVDAVSRGDGKTALMLAVEEKQNAIVGDLLEAGADPNIADTVGNKPIHLATYSVNVLKQLIEYGADCEAEGGFGNRPIHIACCRGRVDAVEFLVKECHVDTSARDKAGKDAVETVRYYHSLRADPTPRTRMLEILGVLSR